MRQDFSHKTLTTFKIHIHVDLRSTLNILIRTNMHPVQESKSSRSKFENSTKKKMHVHIIPTFQRIKVSYYTSINFLKTSFPLVINMNKFGVQNYKNVIVKKQNFIDAQRKSRWIQVTSCALATRGQCLP